MIYGIKILKDNYKNKPWHKFKLRSLLDKNLISKASEIIF